MKETRAIITIDLPWGYKPCCLLYCSYDVQISIGSKSIIINSHLDCRCVASTTLATNAELHSTSQNRIPNNNFVIMKIFLSWICSPLTISLTESQPYWAWEKGKWHITSFNWLSNIHLLRVTHCVMYRINPARHSDLRIIHINIISSINHCTLITGYATCRNHEDDTVQSVFLKKKIIRRSHILLDIAKEEAVIRKYYCFRRKLPNISNYLYNHGCRTVQINIYWQRYVSVGNIKGHICCCQLTDQLI